MIAFIIELDVLQIDIMYLQCNNYTETIDGRHVAIYGYCFNLKCFSVFHYFLALYMYYFDHQLERIT